MSDNILDLYKTLQPLHRVVIDDMMTLDQLTAVAAGRKIDFAFQVREVRQVNCGAEKNTLIDVTHPWGLKRLILVREYKGAFDVFVFEQPEWFEDCSRIDLLDNHQWLFDTELEYETLAEIPFVSEIHDEGQNLYTRVLRDEQGQHEGQGIFTFLIEYKTNPAVDLDRVLIVEAGTLDSDNGGWIEFWNGRLVEPSNVRA